MLQNFTANSKQKTFVESFHYNAPPKKTLRKDLSTQGRGKKTNDFGSLIKIRILQSEIWTIYL